MAGTYLLQDLIACFVRSSTINLELSVIDVGCSNFALLGGIPMSDTKTPPPSPTEPKPEDDPGMHKVDESAQEEAAEERRDIGGYQ